MTSAGHVLQAHLKEQKFFLAIPALLLTVQPGHLFRRNFSIAPPAGFDCRSQIHKKCRSRIAHSTSAVVMSRAESGDKRLVIMIVVRQGFGACANGEYQALFFPLPLAPRPSPRAWE